jgi:hypothetical protein
MGHAYQLLINFPGEQIFLSSQGSQLINPNQTVFFGGMSIKRGTEGPRQARGTIMLYYQVLTELARQGWNQNFW